jgi:2-keto-4-pentenoate hydratase/2-oxohepta-3-ene-1,7-dioic acid hydratase in catechol pathway
LEDVPANMDMLIAGGPAELERVRGAIKHTSGSATIDLSEVDWLPPYPRPMKILGVAFNNQKTRKTAHVDPGVPNYFLKSASCLTGHLKPVIIREFYGETIPEPELCLIIGKAGKDIAIERALDHVFGYSIVNDITSHGMKFSKDSVATTRAPEIMKPEFLSWRKRHGEDDNDLYFVYHTRSKSSDTFGPMGPWLTTADEVADPNNIRIRAYWNDEIFTDDATSSYTFDIQSLIADASKYFTLQAGDIICCGTAAKGNEKFPHAHRNVSLQVAEGVLSVELDGLGKLVNPVVHEWKN